MRSLRAAINEIVAPFGGCLFSAAGDGFMLEFPVASAGVQAAMALLDACKSPTRPLPQIRIGMHLGEVIVEDDGDLLGHGVNIAARLQRHAKPGTMIISQDVRHSVRGEAAKALRPMGTIKLDKMDETIAIYGLDSGAAPQRAWRPSKRSMLIGGGVLALLAVAILAATAIKPHAASARTAVFTFATPTADEPTQTLAGGIANEIVDAMSEIGLQPISRNETSTPPGPARADRATALHAAYALDGDISRDGAVVRVSVRLDDVRAHQTVWAQTFERDSSHMGALRLEVAAAVVDVMRCSSEAREAQLRKAPVAILLRLCALTNQTGSAEYLRLARQLVQATPRSSIAQGRLALAYYVMSDSAPAGQQGQLRLQAMRAADIALQLNPNNGTAASAKAALLRASETRFEYERTQLEFLRRSPDNLELNVGYGYFLRDVGRNEEAVIYLERAAALDPLSTYAAGTLAWGYAIVGRQSEAQTLLDDAAARWPETADIAWARFRTAVWFGTRAEALQILPDNQSWTREEKACWRTAIDGIAATDMAARRRAALEVRRCASQPDQKFQVLAALGDADGAFGTAEATIADQGEAAYSSMYFVPAAQALRRDPRFMPLMQRAGLIAYWRQSGHWPDFCAEPQLPYQCRAEAARLSRER